MSVTLAPSRSSASGVPDAGAGRQALAVLLAINLVNYLDRQVLYALLPLIKTEFAATDTQLGALASAFMIVYMCAAPPIGYWADRTSRKAWIAFGVAFWSVATVFSGLAQTYRQLFAARAAVGIGESCYGAVSPSFVAEHFPAARRAGVLALFSMAIPVGSALGYILGGWAGREFGWRTAFFLAGLPGLALAALAVRLKDPRGEAAPGAPAAPALAEYFSLRHNRSLVFCTLAMSAMTFGMGAMAVWMPSFFTRTWGLDVAKAGTLFGGVTVVSGLVGSLLGGALADSLFRKTGKAYFIVSGVGLVLAVPFGLLALWADSLYGAVAALFLAEMCAFLNMGPLNAVMVSVTDPRVRSMAFAANIFVIHALGDAVSPTIIGRISDLWSLRLGLAVAMSFLGLAGVFCWLGSRTVERDTAGVKDE